jgi:hypothetical protein
MSEDDERHLAGLKRAGKRGRAMGRMTHRPSCFAPAPVFALGLEASHFCQMLGVAFALDGQLCDGVVDSAQIGGRQLN